MSGNAALTLERRDPRTLVTLEAVVFDFDGLILDTEWPIYEATAAAFATFGIEVPVPDWATVVGLADVDHDWFGLLAQRLRFTLSQAEFEAAYQAQDRSRRDLLEPLVGVVELLDALTTASVPVGIASSSDLAWIEKHLARVGLRDGFEVIVGVDHDDVGGVGKPDPAVYRIACRELGADPARTVALEDSAHGVAAAKAAGLRVVAVPNRITRHSALDHADLVARSLAEVTVEGLAALVS